MSCRTTPAGSAWTTFSRLESGLTDVQTLSAFHALRREGNGVPAPTVDEWDEFVETQMVEMEENGGFSEARTRSLRDRMTRAMETIPDGASWYALRNIRERGQQEAANVEASLRGFADRMGQDYETVATRYNTYLAEVDRSRTTTAPEGYDQARDTFRTQGLPFDHGTYTAYMRIAEEANAAVAADTERPRRVTPVPFPNSRAIDSAGYDAHDGRLEITFRRRDRNGVQTGVSRTYGYRGVTPEVWEAMCGEEGPGTVYNREIRNHSEFRYDSREDEDAAAHRRCANCGQWMGSGHTCPLPVRGGPVSTAVPVGRQRTRAEHLAVGAEISAYLAANPTVAEPQGGAFDADSGRCIDCDGHYTHTSDCSTLTSSPAAGLSDAALAETLGVDDMSVIDREVQAALAATTVPPAASGAAPRRGLTMVDQLGNVHAPDAEADADEDREARVRYLEEVEGMSTTAARAMVDAEDVLAHEAASRAADLADQDEAAFLRCPDCGQYMDGAHTCTPAATETVSDAEHQRNIADLRARLTSTPTSTPTEPAVVLDDSFGPEDAQEEMEAAARAAAEAPVEPVVPERPEAVPMRTAGAHARWRNINARRMTWQDPGYRDRASIPTATDIRPLAVAQPVIVPVSYTGRRRVFHPETVGTDGLPSGYFSVNGAVTFDRPGRGQWDVTARELQCTCAAYAANHHCPHVDYVLNQYRQHLIPQTTRAGAAATPVDPAVAQAAAEAAMRQDWMRSEEGAEEARARHLAASDPQDSYTNNFEAFEADHNAALARKAAGEEPVVFMTENATNGVFTRESGRGFGVEMEFDFPPTMSHSERRTALANIARELHEAGLTPVDYQQGYHSSARRGYTDVHAGGWSFEQDCTVSGEVVSPVMYDEPETWENIQKVCDIVRNHGGIANAKTGSHVHVGAKNMTPQTATELMRMTNQHEDIMYRISQNPDRPKHRPMSWCGPNEDVPQGGYASSSNLRYVGSGHRNGMNLAGVRGAESDHPEVRYWDGTLSPAVIQAQIKVSGALVTAAERNGTLDQSRRNREQIGSHATRLTAVRGRSRRALTSEELQEDTATVRSLADTLFTRREDKAQMTSLFAITKWQAARR